MCSPLVKIFPMEMEKALMRSLNDLEIVAIMIGDIELFMSGLYQVQRAKKGKNEGNHFLNICRQLLPKTDVLKFDMYN